MYGAGGGRELLVRAVKLTLAQMPRKRAKMFRISQTFDRGINKGGDSSLVSMHIGEAKIQQLYILLATGSVVLVLNGHAKPIARRTNQGKRGVARTGIEAAACTVEW